jgi:hypothetical protein
MYAFSDDYTGKTFRTNQNGILEMDIIVVGQGHALALRGKMVTAFFP